MTKPNVFITRALSEDCLEELYKIAHVKMWPHEDLAVPRDVLLEEAKRAEGLITMLSDQIDQELFEHAPHLKVVANLAVGFDNIDLQAANEKGVVVCNTPDVLTNTTADLTFGLLMATARRLIEAADYVKTGDWKSWSPLLLAGHDIHHKTIGIVGMGSIGRAVAKRAKGFEMDILYHNRSRNVEAEEQLDATYATFDEIITESDFVVCLTPLTSETKRKFDATAFKKMKKTAIFINVSRGAVVDEEALLHALQTGEIAAAGLDVFDKEPIGPSHPLLSLKNVVALPHIGSSSVETRKTMMKLCSENVLSVLTNKPPKTAVNQG